MIGKTETLHIPSFAYLKGSFLMSKAGNRFRGQGKRTHITHKLRNKCNDL